MPIVADYSLVSFRPKIFPNMVFAGSPLIGHFDTEGVSTRGTDVAYLQLSFSHFVNEGDDDILVSLNGEELETFEINEGTSTVFLRSRLDHHQIHFDPGLLSEAPEGGEEGNNRLEISVDNRTAVVIMNLSSVICHWKEDI